MDAKLNRATRAPDGGIFPRSHFGPIDERVALLRAIADTLQLDTQTVLNMGAGYDMSPSIAFPDSRVVHVDLSPNEDNPYQEDVVGFLKGEGYEAYTPGDLPDDFRADLGLDMRGPGIEPRLIKLGGTIISTSTYIPDHNVVIGLVDSGAKRRIVTDRDEIAEMRDDEEPVHLVISRNLPETYVVQGRTVTRDEMTADLGSAVAGMAAQFMIAMGRDPGDIVELFGGIEEAEGVLGSEIFNELKRRMEEK